MEQSYGLVWISSFTSFMAQSEKAKMKGRGKLTSTYLPSTYYRQKTFGSPITCIFPFRWPSHLGDWQCCPLISREQLLPVLYSHFKPPGPLTLFLPRVLFMPCLSLLPGPFAPTVPCAPSTKPQAARIIPTIMSTTWSTWLCASPSRTRGGETWPST